MVSIKELPHYQFLIMNLSIQKMQAYVDRVYNLRSTRDIAGMMGDYRTYKQAKISHATEMLKDFDIAKKPEERTIKENDIRDRNDEEGASEVFESDDDTEHRYVVVYDQIGKTGMQILSPIVQDRI